MGAPMWPAPGPVPAGTGSVEVACGDDPSLAVHLRTARAWGLGVLASLTALLGLTGVALLFLYVPDSTGVADGASTLAALGRAVQSIHLLAAWLSVFTAICTGVVVLVERGLARRWFSASLGPLAGLVALSALVSGLPLAWNELGTTPSSTGGDGRGYGFLLRGDGGSVLTDYGRVSVVALTWNLGLHVVAGASLVVVAAMVWRLRHEAPTELTDLQRAERLARRRGLRRF